MIYIVTHKQFPNPELKGYCPLQVGASLHDDLGYLRDDTGDNISIKNPNFCELTGLYWVWKNCDDEYKGIVHYRRYFGKSNLSSRISNIYSYEEMISKLEKYDIVLPYIEHFKQNAHDELMIKCSTETIFNNLRNIVEKKHPNYISSFDSFFSQNRAVLFNMLFCRREIFDSYCSWLFDILLELANITNLDLLNEYQKRQYGFLSERLLNIWVSQNKIKAINTSIIATELKLGDKLDIIRRRTTNQMQYLLSKI